MGDGGILVLQDVGIMKSLHWRCEIWVDCVERKEKCKASLVCNGSLHVRCRAVVPGVLACVSYVYFVCVCAYMCMCVCVRTCIFV